MNAKESRERERRAFKCAFKACADLHDLVTDEKRASAIMWLSIALVHLVNADEDKTSMDMVIGALEKSREQRRAKK